MVKITKIYTRTGDDGTTGLVGGARTRKDSDRVEAYGEVDELNSWLGMARTVAEALPSPLVSERLSRLQNFLFDLGSELATPSGESWEGMIVADEGHVATLERWIDEFSEGIPELRSFVLPGGTELNALLHMARTVCRRAERQTLRLSRTEEVSPHLIKALNRLSDLLFAMARFESHRAHAPEYLWEPGRKLG